MDALILFHLAIAPLSANSFTLDDVSELFPYKGLESRIDFWKLIFTDYGERDVVFHDEEDLRLIYHVERFARERRNDPAEIRRQRHHLRRQYRQIRTLFDEIIQYGIGSDRLRLRHNKIVEQIEKAGYPMTTGTLQNLKARIRYQRGIKEKFRESLIRSGLYLDRMRSIFESYNLPAQLTYLPHVESSFDYTAYSKAGAAGIWQFTRGTGRSYLRINGFMDERLDPVRATDAAARLMRDNYAVLGNWPLTITSYNHGKNGMLRAKSQYGNDITRIIDNYKSRYFGFASKNFYAEFLAALYVAENYEKYFGSLPIAAPLEFDTIRTEKPYDSSYYTTVPGLSFEILSSYNPHLRRVFARSGRVVPAGIDLRVPIGKGEPLRVALQNARPSASGLILASDGSTRYRVRPGDVLGNIAADFGTSVDSIKSLNRIKNANRIYPGQMLLVTPPTGAVSSGTRSAEPAVPSVYRVRSGDSLTNIAKRFRTDVDELARLNSISNPNRLYPGMKLRISPGNEEETRIYQVRPGDTLAKIARRFGTSVSSLKRANRIRNPHLIKEGQELVIP